jgi:polyhydroxybutyrate depolymerase
MSTRSLQTIVLAAMVATLTAVVLYDALQPIPAASAGPVPSPSDDDCHDLDKPGSPAEGVTISGPDRLLIRVRVPINYDPRRAYPLLVAYPPAGYDRFAAERFYDLTDAATSKGWIVAYSDARPLSRNVVKLQASVAGRVAKSFCIAPNQIAAFGHSDGGALAQGTAALAPSQLKPRAIFASAAGITRNDLDAQGCVAGTSVMIAHNDRDERFPGFGRDAAAFWASCGGCQAPDAGDIHSETCRRFSGCAEAAEVRYCDVSTPHGTLPPLTAQALEFLSTVALGSRKQHE